jgi:predicted nucleic acid-binding protein
VKEYDVKVFLEALHQTAKFTRIKSKFNVVTADPADDIILRTAVDGKADCIVSGDKHLLALKEFRGIKILTVDEMLSLLKEEKPPK